MKKAIQKLKELEHLLPRDPSGKALITARACEQISKGEILAQAVYNARACGLKVRMQLGGTILFRLEDIIARLETPGKKRGPKSPEVVL